MANEKKVLLKISGLKKYFPVTQGLIFSSLLGHVKAVDGVDFVVHEGETYGLVGESGCGKTTIAKMILLIERPTEGTIEFEGMDINQIKGDQLKDYRRLAQAVFQDPMSSLNPRMRVWEIITEPMVVTQPNVTKQQAKDRAAELLTTVGLIPDNMHLYPHQFSGGQRQRVAIARALVTKPNVILADEPTGNLDRRNATQVQKLMLELNKELGTAFVIVTHDHTITKSMDKVYKLEDGILSKS